MACPYFCPVERADDLPLPHPSRLPLRAAWRGTCFVTGQTPDAASLAHCNMGYARECAHLPTERPHDALRFQVESEQKELVVLKCYRERGGRPVDVVQITVASCESTAKGDPVTAQARAFLASRKARAAAASAE